MKTILFLASILIISSQSFAKTNEAAEIWPRVQAAIEQRNSEDVHQAFEGLSDDFRIENNDGERKLLSKSDVVRAIDNVILNLKNCDIGLEKKNIRLWQKCRSPISESDKDRNHIAVYLDSFKDFSKNLPVDSKKLFAKFDEAQKLLEDAEAIKKDKAKSDHQKFLAAQKKADIEAKIKSDAEEAYLKTPDGKKKEACKAYQRVEEIHKNAIEQKQQMRKVGNPTAVIEQVFASRLSLMSGPKNRGDAFREEYESMTKTKLDLKRDCGI